MSDEAPLLLQREGPVLRAVLNRPHRRNALSLELGLALDDLVASLPAQRDIRVLVITGAGGHFCSGFDLTEAQTPMTPEERLAAQLARNRRTAERFRGLSALPQVVIAAVQGSCFAGGLGFLCAADIAFASADARFAAPEVRRGLVPAQILPWLARRMGRAAATRFVLEGTTVDAAGAARIGLVHEIVPDAAALEQAVRQSIGAILQGAPEALAETKGLLAALGPVAPEPYADAGAQSFARCVAGPEAQEGISAFREKRKPAWAP